MRRSGSSRRCWRRSRWGTGNIDCASFYGNEIEVGEGIRESGLPRAEIFVTGKVWNDCQGFERCIQSCEKSLRDLGLRYFDLLLVHWPLPGYFRETYRALEHLHGKGRVRSLGLSNFTVEDYQDLEKTLKIPCIQSN